ncbi:MAG: hydrogenase expression/formation C-terminal domain-containing protein [Rivihabitans pingtungensis]|jgi:hydrogenase-1 operon protein HyaF|uniref:hydrogenase expression/formation protein n=2 Tax=Rivihabitans pingtungensis TaxID=1054498 RepID=UPI002CC0EFE3|nr:hydrogenase expression/formation C-terminal domain-containing protein [Rivihabitans pingtungensis]HNX71378.1 hydrogenase expression/formation C-terminal domain-containing protein [Rivihabitans pingtungensis]
MKPFPLPVVALGAGSQPEDPDLAYMPLPGEVESFIMPALPSSEDVSHLGRAIELIGQLAALAARWQPGERCVRELAGLNSEELALVNQVLGEGEVSAKALLADGGEARIQESVFAGVWRVCRFDANGQQTGDSVEVAPIPELLIERAQAASRWLDALPPMPATLMNAAPIGAELLARQRQALDSPHVINFTLLPVTPDDLAWITDLVGEGAVGIFSRGYGKCRVLATALTHVWRVQYFNTMNTLLLDTLEITRIPDVTLADGEDIADSAERLGEAHHWLCGAFDHV